MDFTERYKCRLVLRRLSLARNLEKPELDASELGALGDEREAAKLQWGRGAQRLVLRVNESRKKDARSAAKTHF